MFILNILVFFGILHFAFASILQYGILHVTFWPNQYMLLVSQVVSVTVRVWSRADTTTGRIETLLVAGNR